MATWNAISAERARQLIDYDPETGALTWKPRTPDMFKKFKRSPEWSCRNWNAHYAGLPAGTASKDRYVKVFIDGKLHGAHRLAWLLHYGVLPTRCIDHKNGIRSDNRIVNLRDASHKDNGQNRKTLSNNSSGFPGVSMFGSGKWRSRIMHNGKSFSLGVYEDPRAAYDAYLEAKKGLHNFHPEPRSC
jgi:hypothetical protein